MKFKPCSITILILENVWSLKYISEAGKPEYLRWFSCFNGRRMLHITMGYLWLCNAVKHQNVIEVIRINDTYQIDLYEQNTWLMHSYSYYAFPRNVVSHTITQDIHEIIHMGIKTYSPRVHYVLFSPFVPASLCNHAFRHPTTRGFRLQSCENEHNAGKAVHWLTQIQNYELIMLQIRQVVCRYICV